MRRNERAITDQAAIEQILQQAQYCNLAMCDGDQPYIVPLCFGYAPPSPEAGLGWLYFHCATEGRKLDILRRNGRVTFSAVADAAVTTAPTACGFSFRYRSVVGTGVAEVLKDEAARRQGLDCIMRHYGFPGQPGYDAKALAKTAVVGIRIDTLAGKANP